MNRVALITGASSGIGVELARVFAAQGHRVALVARREDRLHTVAGEIIAAGGATPILIPCDLAQRDSGDRIAQALIAANAEVEFVVNNAGYGLFGRAMQLCRDDQLGIVDVNIRALTDLTLRFAESVIRHRGGILNVASVAGFMPGPGMAAYYASKAFVLSFTEALHAELKPLGVRVCVLCPGPVPSEFQSRAGYRAGMHVTPIDVAPDRVARAAYDGLMAGTRVVLPGIAAKLVPLWVRLTPRALVLAMIDRVQMRRR